MICIHALVQHWQQVAAPNCILEGVCAGPAHGRGHCGQVGAPAGRPSTLPPRQARLQPPAKRSIINGQHTCILRTCGVSPVFRALLRLGVKVLIRSKTHLCTPCRENKPNDPSPSPTHCTLAGRACAPKIMDSAGHIKNLIFAVALVFCLNGTFRCRHQAVLKSLCLADACMPALQTQPDFSPAVEACGPGTIASVASPAYSYDTRQCTALCFRELLWAS